jgi:hypothetical protein
MAEKKIGYSEPSSYIPKDIRKKYGVGEYFKQELGNIDSVWKRIIELEGETFYTATGLPFTYKVINDHQIKPYRDGKSRWTISKALIEKAMEQPRWNGTEFNKTIVASSYVAGILNDRRLGI